jgi:hypothetical protein
VLGDRVETRLPIQLPRHECRAESVVSCYFRVTSRLKCCSPLGCLAGHFYFLLCSALEGQPASSRHVVVASVVRLTLTLPSSHDLRLHLARSEDRLMFGFRTCPHRGGHPLRCLVLDHLGRHGKAHPSWTTSLDCIHQTPAWQQIRTCMDLRVGFPQRCKWSQSGGGSPRPLLRWHPSRDLPADAEVLPSRRLADVDTSCSTAGQGSEGACCCCYCCCYYHRRYRSNVLLTVRVV